MYCILHALKAIDFCVNNSLVFAEEIFTFMTAFGSDSSFNTTKQIDSSVLIHTFGVVIT